MLRQASLLASFPSVGIQASLDAHEEVAMDTIFAKVAGLEVHQKFITVGIRCRLETGKLFAEVRTFGTMTRDLMALADYLEALGVTHVATSRWGQTEFQVNLKLGLTPMPDPHAHAPAVKVFYGLNAPPWKFCRAEASMEPQGDFISRFAFSS